MKSAIVLFLTFMPLCILAQESCFAEGLTLYDQSQVTNFAQNYPDCTSIEGDLILNGNVNFIGMEQLVEIQGYIRCGGDGECVNAGPHEDFLGLENVTILGGIDLEEHSFSFEGLSSLETINENFLLEECYITDFGALSSLVSIGGDFHMNETDFESFNGLENVVSVGGFFRVYDNNTLLTTDAVGSLISVGGYFQFDDCPSLTDFTYFTQLTQVGGDFEISDCPSISTLEGFENVMSIDGELLIVDCPALINIEGVASIDSESITSVSISNNPMLSYCSVASVCGHLLDGGESAIQMNSDGCATTQEVESQCFVNIGVVDAVLFSIKSNVVNDALQVTNPMNINFRIYNQEGKMVQQTNGSGTIFVNELSAGMYTISAVEHGVQLRFVKE